MTVTLNLKPEIQAGLHALAEQKGVSIEEYLRSLVEDTVWPAPLKTPTPEARAALWRETAKDFPDTPPLSDDAVSRDSMYAAPDWE